MGRGLEAPVLKGRRPESRDCAEAARIFRFHAAARGGRSDTCQATLSFRRHDELAAETSGGLDQDTRRLWKAVNLGPQMSGLVDLHRAAPVVERRRRVTA